MADFYNELNDLVNDIMDCKVTKAETGNRITDLKKRYGSDSFPDLYFQPQSRPWDKNYLRKLKEMNISGACSEKFILHMAEVSEEINAKKKRRVIGIVIVIIVLVILVIILCMNRSVQAEAALENTAEVITAEESDFMDVLVDEADNI